MRKSGFSLVELVIALCLIGVGSIVLGAFYGGIKDNAIEKQKAQVADDLNRMIGAAVAAGVPIQNGSLLCLCPDAKARYGTIRAASSLTPSEIVKYAIYGFVTPDGCFINYTMPEGAMLNVSAFAVKNGVVCPVDGADKRAFTNKTGMPSPYSDNGGTVTIPE